MKPRMKDKLYLFNFFGVMGKVFVGVSYTGKLTCLQSHMSLLSA